MIQVASFPAKDATVNVVRIDASGVPLRFEITTTTGYRAVIPACLCEDRVPCLKRACLGRNHCHGDFGFGKHVEHVMELARQVAKSYGSANRGRTDPSSGRARLRQDCRVKSMSVRDWEPIAAQYDRML